MGDDLHVDSTVMGNAETALRALPNSLTTPIETLQGVNIRLGDFDEGRALMTTVNTGIDNWETGARVLSRGFTDGANVLHSATTILVNSDDDDDIDVIEDIGYITGQV